MLPLSIAGEKPDEAWFDELIERGRARGPAASPSVRALGRPAAARRDRPRARLAADRHLRRRADRQPRLEDERRDPRAPAPLGARLRADDRDGHPRRARRGDRRPRPLPRRRSDRQGGRAEPRRTTSSPRWSRSAPSDPVRAQGHARPQAAHGPDRARNRSRRRDGERHLRAHRLDRRRVQHDLHRRLSRHGRHGHGQDSVRPGRQRQRRAAVLRVGARRGEGSPRRRPGGRRRRR